MTQRCEFVPERASPLAQALVVLIGGSKPELFLDRVDISLQAPLPRALTESATLDARAAEECLHGAVAGGLLEPGKTPGLAPGAV